MYIYLSYPIEPVYGNYTDIINKDLKQGLQ